MKFLFSFLFLLFAYFGSANTVENVKIDNFSTEISSTFEFYDLGKKAKRARRKKARRGQKMNKKRKRACGTWGKRSYAG